MHVLLFIFAVNIGTSHLFRHSKNVHANRPTVESALEKTQAKRSSGPLAAKCEIMDILAKQTLSPYASQYQKRTSSNSLEHRSSQPAFFVCRGSLLASNLVQKQIHWTDTPFIHKKG